jgi:hypothetical protein
MSKRNSLAAKAERREQREQQAIAADGWHPLTRVPPEKCDCFVCDHAVSVGRERGEHAWERWEIPGYFVAVYRRKDGSAEVIQVFHNSPSVPWDDMQAIKTQLAGPEAEAYEVYPAESRVLDMGECRWLWCKPPGEHISADLRTLHRFMDKPTPGAVEETRRLRGPGLGRRPQT